MIPAFDHSGVLPPFLGADSTESDKVAPYDSDILELVKVFATSHERIDILRGFLKFREDLAGFGFVSGFQWLDGSFLEDCETLRGRAPDDIDLVSFLNRPSHITNDTEWISFFPTVAHLFDSSKTKTAYNCDAYAIDLNSPSEHLVSMTSYWFGVFSHRRQTYQWKGMLRIPMYDANMDQLAKQYLDGVVNP